MDGVDEGGVMSIQGALGPAELSVVVGDVFEEDAHHQHPQEGRQGDAHTEQPGEQLPQQLD